MPDQTVADLKPTDRILMECRQCFTARAICHQELPPETTIERIKDRARCFKCGSKDSIVVVDYFEKGH